MKVNLCDEQLWRRDPGRLVMRYADILVLGDKRFRTFSTYDAGASKLPFRASVFGMSLRRGCFVAGSGRLPSIRPPAPS
jgi:hypothetical protein